MALRVNVRVEGDTITPALRKLKRGCPDSIRSTIRTVAYDIRNTAMLSLQTPKSGRIYKRGGVLHQASAPGEPPATDTGDLLSHISVHARRMYTDVGAEVLHGLYMEFGMKRRGQWHVRPRPFLRPAYERHAPKIEEVLRRNIARYG